MQQVSDEALKQSIEWMNKQQTLYRQGKLQEQDIRDLENLEGWKWDYEPEPEPEPEPEQEREDYDYHDNLNRHENEMRQKLDAYITNKKKVR